MSDINVNQGRIDPSLYQTVETGVIKGPSILPSHDDVDVLEDANATGLNATAKMQLHMAPVLFQDPSMVHAQTSSIVLKTDSGKPVNYPAPNRFDDMLASASMLSASGDIPLKDFIKSVQDAIKSLQDALVEEQQRMAKVDKELHMTSFVDAKDNTEEMKAAIARAQERQKATAKVEAKMQEIQNAVGGGGVEGQAGVQEAINKLLGDSGLDPKISDMILALGQLQYLQQHSPDNASGGVIIGNNPEVVAALQKLGFELPKANPDVPFAGMAAKLASQNKPPYNNPAFKALANSLPKGWEVIMPNDLTTLMQNIAKEIRSTAGKSYGILAKPLQGLFGSTLFSLNSNDTGKINEIKELMKLKDLLNEYENCSPHERYKFAKEHQKKFEKAFDKGLIEYYMTPMYFEYNKHNMFGGSLGSNSIFRMAKERLKDMINERGGEKMLENKDPPLDPSGVGRLASGALVGGMTSSISEILNSLFQTEMNNSFQDSTLPAKDKKNIQQLASITLLTTVLGDALHSSSVLDAKGPHNKLENAIKSLKDSGSAQNIMDTVFSGSIDGQSLTSYQRQVLQEATKAFMINIGAITTTAGEAGVSSSKAYSTLSSLKASSVSSDALAAKTFWDAKSDQLSDASKFADLARQIAPNADHASGSIETQEALREMIKLLKKILEQLLSGGQSSQQLGDLIKKVKEGFGELNAQGFTNIHG